MKKRETRTEREREAGLEGEASATAVRAAKQDKSSGGTPPPVR